jgi:prepilin-type N-terminal cleavage/methylation domain-containing protein
MNTKKQLIRGFTLVELIVVIVIIGVLAAITVVAYNGIQTRAHDTAVLSDIDTMDAIQTNYGVKNNTVGKAYYSVTDGYSSALGFAPTNGDVIDVVVNTTDYCIRGFNPNGAKNSIFNAFTKESTAGVCSQIPPSTPAITTLATPTLVLGTVTSSEIDSHLQATITGADTYTLQRDTSSSFTAPIQVANQSGTSFISSGLLSSTTYYYRTRANTNTGYISSWSNTVSATTSVINYTLTTIAGANGTVSSGGTYALGSTPTITATPNAFYSFSSWTGDTGCSGTASHTITMDANKSCTANFTPT